MFRVPQSGQNTAFQDQAGIDVRLEAVLDSCKVLAIHSSGKKSPFMIKALSVS
jgi:hypothetical protein